MIRRLKKVFEPKTWNVLLSPHKIARVWNFKTSDLRTYSFVDRDTNQTRNIILPGQLLIPDQKQYWGVTETFYDLTDKESENISIVMHGFADRYLLCDNYDDATCNSFPHLLIVKPEIDASKTNIFPEWVPEAEVGEEKLTVLLRIENARWTPISCKLDFWAIDLGDFTVWDVKPITQQLLEITLDISKITKTGELKMHPYRACMTSRRAYSAKDAITVGKIVAKKAKSKGTLVFSAKEAPYDC